jgi:para-nitrobenzyl esterase
MTRAGPIEGTTRTFRRGRVRAFLGIPYARAPEHAERLRMAAAPEVWSEPRPAKRFGAAAPQEAPPFRFTRRLLSGARQSEDCLHLNVWTPGTDAGRRPVLVWLHGGAFVMGTAGTPIYTGSRLALRGDVVVVTLNYRLGAFGFLDLGGQAGGPPTNLGLRDQVRALEWVRDNIEVFGGDPGNVTLFGESAGAMSIGALLGVAQARGLYHKVVLQSGAAQNVSPRARALEIGARLLEELRLDPAELSALHERPTHELLAAQGRVLRTTQAVSGALPWQPSIDSDFLPEPPLEAVRAGLARDVPMLIGTNREEWKLFRIGDPRQKLEPEDFERRIRRTLAGSGDAEAALAHYRADPGVRRRATPEDAWVAFQSDRVFHHPASRLADAHAHAAHATKGGGRTFMYLFTWRPPLLSERLGSCHALEIPFVFGTLRSRVVRPWLLASPGALRLSDRIQDAWIAFARTGDPSHEGLPDWPAYSPTTRSVMELGSTCRPLDDPHGHARAFWGDVF